MISDLRSMAEEVERMKRRELERDKEHVQELQAIAPKPCQRCSGMVVITEAERNRGLAPRKHPGALWDPEAHEWDI